MRINNNVMALNAHRQLGINQGGAAKSMEKLSSGFRINRAGDDAAGLAISEKMRGQIRGLKQASRNAQDGISLIQTAEGALNETHAILQRMRELAVQSSTDTNTEADRAEIQKEINQLASEITRIAETTEFNTQTLLDGKFSSIFHIGANEGQNVDLAIRAMDANALKVAGSGAGEATFSIEANDVVNVASTALAVGEYNLDVVKLDNVTMADDTVANYGLANEKGEIVAVSQDGEEYVLLGEATKEGKLANTAPVAGKIIEFSDKVISGKVSLTVEAGTNDEEISLTEIKATASVEVQGLEAGEYRVATFDENVHLTDVEFADGTDETAAHPSLVLLNGEGDVVAVSSDGKAWYGVDDVDLTADMANDWDTDVVGDAKALMTVEDDFVNGDKFEVKADEGIDVSSQKSADKAITTINKALEEVSAERSKLGAMQNRLEHTIANLGTSAENLQAAEARIRDLDMAE
ncbi:MAG: flagellin, partial [Firmicutes bacterium]|nr:flagellin [Bacillota bacterium]